METCQQWRNVFEWIKLFLPWLLCLRALKLSPQQPSNYGKLQLERPNNGNHSPAVTSPRPPACDKLALCVCCLLFDFSDKTTNENNQNRIYFIWWYKIAKTLDMYQPRNAANANERERKERKEKDVYTNPKNATTQKEKKKALIHPLGVGASC